MNPGSDDDVADDDDTTPSMCGDGVTEGAELCDDGPANGSFACGCQLDCRFAPDTTPCDDLLFCTDSDRCDGPAR